MSEALVIPDGRDAVLALDSKTLFSSDVDTFMDEIWVERERRLREWAAADWTQTRIAEEVGRSQGSVSNWMAKFGITPSRPTAKRVLAPNTQESGYVGDGVIEVVDGEVVILEKPETAPVTGSRTVAGVKFPGGGIADTADLTAYNTRNLKVVAENLIRRATPQEAKALHQLFLKYADMAERKAGQ